MDRGASALAFPTYPDFVASDDAARAQTEAEVVAVAELVDRGALPREDAVRLGESPVAGVVLERRPELEARVRQLAEEAEEEDRKARGIPSVVIEGDLFAGEKSPHEVRLLEARRVACAVEDAGCSEVEARNAIRQGGDAIGLLIDGHQGRRRDRDQAMHRALALGRFRATARLFARFRERRAGPTKRRGSRRGTGGRASSGDDSGPGEPEPDSGHLGVYAKPVG
jgi:hypothetical protein